MAETNKSDLVKVEINKYYEYHDEKRGCFVRYFMLPEHIATPLQKWIDGCGEAQDDQQEG